MERAVFGEEKRRKLLHSVPVAFNFQQIRNSRRNRINIISSGFNSFCTEKSVRNLRLQIFPVLPRQGKGAGGIHWQNPHSFFAKASQNPLEIQSHSHKMQHSKLLKTSSNPAPFTRKLFSRAAPVTILRSQTSLQGARAGQDLKDQTCTRFGLNTLNKHTELP